MEWLADCHEREGELALLALTMTAGIKVSPAL